jgi:N,N-dimethylformamidase beta subunit-like protein
VKITSAAVGTGWPAAVDMIDTTGWESGYYTIDFILAADKYRDLNVASLVVLPSVNHVDVLVELSTNTYQAYNVWGDIVSTKVFLSGIGGR